MTSRQDAIRKCNYLKGAKQGECLEMVELCAAGKTTIRTDVGEVKATSVESCFEKAPKLAGMGYKILSGKAPPGAAPVSIPTEDSAAHSNDGQSQTMREGEVREGFCTERTGFVPTPRAKLAWIDGSPRLVIDGEPMEQGQSPLPILNNRTGGSSRRVIMLPYREVHFKLGKAEPVRKSKFQRTIGRMIGDMKNVISGPFAKICGLDYLKEFAGDLTLYVVGKTDRLGTEEHNLELSEARAKTVADAIDAQRDEISSALWGGGRGLRIKYLGAGEYLTETDDGVASPDDRRVELYLSTEGPPVEGGWVEIGDPPGGADPSNYLEYYCGGADSDCKNVLAQCEASLKIMCDDAYPYSQIDGNRCAAEAGAWMASGRVGDPEVKRWIEKGYFRFPIAFREGVHKGVEFAKTLNQCLRRAPAISRRAYVSDSSPSELTLERVRDMAAVRGTIPRGTRYCTAEHGWMESSRTTITETPRGEMLWYDGKPAATFGQEWIKITKGKRDTLVEPAHEVDLRGDNSIDVANAVTRELLDFIFAGEFTSRCMGGKKQRTVLIEFWADSIGMEIQTKMEEVLELISAMLMEYEDSLDRGVRLGVRFNVIDPFGRHRGLFVSASLPIEYGQHEQQGTYGPRPKNGADGAIEVIPLK
jgi:hypothetical protein